MNNDLQSARRPFMAGDVPLSAMRPYAAPPRPSVALEPIGADDPRVAPYAADLDARRTVADDVDERKQLVIDGSRQKIDAAEAAVVSAQEHLMAAQKAFDEAVATRARATEEYYKAHGVYPAQSAVMLASPAHALAPGEPTVLMFFPHAVNLRSDDGRVGEYPIGIHAVPESYVNHWWLAAHGVRPYGGSAVGGPRTQAGSYKAGDRVRIVTGPGQDKTGSIEAVEPDGRVSVRLDDGSLVGGIAQAALARA